MNNETIYEQVTETILSALDRGVVPWRKPWTPRLGAESGLHRNLVSRKAYRGVNQFLCDIAAFSGGYSSPYWLTFNQAKQRGGKVRKGEKGTLVVFWKLLRKRTDEFDSQGRPVVKTIPLLRHYYVFNVDQVDGVEAPVVEADADAPEFDPITAADVVIDGMPNRPVTFHGASQAFYQPGNDSLHLPDPEDFHRNTAYYTVAYHEMVHSTGHEQRLGRVKEWGTFGSDPYAKEELVAELGSAMLAATVGVTAEQEQSAAYIAGWSRRFKQDPKLIVSAAGLAQKAADYILGTEFDDGEAKPEAQLAHT